MERNDPLVVSQVKAAFLDYERALRDRDLSAMASYFDDSDQLVRFGVADMQVGAEELAEWRLGQPPIPEGRTLSSTVVSSYGTELAVVTTLFHYPNRDMTGRQSQTWVRQDGRWRIVHAHVSEIPAVT